MKSLADELFLGFGALAGIADSGRVGRLGDSWLTIRAVWRAPGHPFWLLKVASDSPKCSFDSSLP
jgi:hypothetical protein